MKVPEKTFNYNESWLQYPAIAHENSSKDEAELSTILDYTEDLIENCRNFMEFLTEQEMVEPMNQLRRVNSMLENVMLRIQNEFNDRRDRWIIVQQIQGQEYIIGNKIWYIEEEADEAYRNTLCTWFKEATHKDRHVLFTAQPRLRKIQWCNPSACPSQCSCPCTSQTQD